jgi:acetolactate synthase-1/2/3 large subunit
MSGHAGETVHGMGASGGEIVSEALARYGTRTVFALAGAGHAHLLDALDRNGFRIVGARHETGAIAAADGYSRVSGRIGVALTITDQGLPNAITGLACAYHACSPVIVLMARLPDAWIEPEAEHDSLSLSLLRPVTKWCRTVPSAARLAEYVDVACRRALAGRPGPVVLQVPQEFLSQTLEVQPGSLPPPAEIAVPHPDPAAIERAADLIAAARRPLVVTGAGATRGHAADSLREASEEYGLPVAGNGLGRGVVEEDWRLGFSWPLAQIAAREADVVLVLGARLKQRLGYGLPPRFAAGARFIQVDVEAEELSRNRRIDVPIVADAGLAAAALLGRLRQRRYAGAPEPGWLLSALEPRLGYLDRLAASGEGPIHPLRLGRELAQRLPSDAIVVGDGADIQNWMYGALRVRQAPGFLDHYPLGAMGVGTPLAVGAAAAAREMARASGGSERRVVLVTGDGSLGFHPAEIHAAALAGFPLVTVVGNDGAWGTELHGQRQAIGRDLNTALGVQRWNRLADVFGVHGEHVGDLSSLGPALDRALAAGTPAIVDVEIDPQSGAALKTEPLARMIMFDDLVTGLAARQGTTRP